MSDTQKTIIELEEKGVKANGIFKEGKHELRGSKPLIVLIHGGGTNATYFDNSFHSIPAVYNAQGFDVLNINRAAYGGNPIPDTKTPILDSIPLYANLIKKTYKEHSNGQNGIILIGHSLGAAISLSLAAFHGNDLPLLGISALGIIPTKDHPTGLIQMLKADPENPRFVVEPTPESTEVFMGPPEVIDQAVITHPSMLTIFEPGPKSELLEWFDETWYHRFVNEVAPGIRVPLQYLAAEFELGWRSIEAGQPIFDHAAGLFVNAPRKEARILPGGGHDFEFSKNAWILQAARDSFVDSLVPSTPTSVDPAAFSKIPLLDFALSRDPATKPRFLDDLRKAIVNVGFFYVKNTTVSPTTQDNLIKKGIELLELPLEEKLKIEMANSKHFLGYARLGNEITALKPDYREQFDFATECPAPSPDEPVWKNLRGPNQWPDETVIPGFRPTVESYMSEIDTFSKLLSTLVAEALDLPADAFDQFFETPAHNKLKLVKYPAPPSNAESQGVGSHKDGSFLTFLLQATEHTGLEIQNKNGDWIQAKPIPGTLVINIGRSLQALTGGVCTATTHRVNLSPENFIDKDGKPLGPRYSFPIFQGVKTDLDKDAINLKIPQHIKDLVKDEKVRSEAESTFDKMFGDSTREAIFISRVTSHQDVGARWYPDVLEKALKAQREFAAKA
ncbi:related to oxidoreductase, 2OG-Fe(II) oxygenase family [Phialocephala subalpina]|uniref:Related to oxidoreductase, 2OG-Fe(II) oxygenase family n=1 Tax=Phialocephala subalpina TaxID=576137 RepID=A0A1L7XK64_9HELO|nr:related to oxidoreductase, 2OG-Fe(II) oxygenase family [Phialocephala subalpina]